jgi:hypothetical protein
LVPLSSCLLALLMPVSLLVTGTKQAGQTSPTQLCHVAYKLLSASTVRPLNVGNILQLTPSGDTRVQICIARGQVIYLTRGA